MKLVLVLMLCAVAAAAPKGDNEELNEINRLADDIPGTNNALVNVLIRQLFAFLRHIINNGSNIFGIPPLDPLELDHFHLKIPAGLINLDLDLKGIHASGFGSFVVHKSHGNLPDLTLDVDISIPTVNVRADEYELVGDLFTALPLYGKGNAVFKVEGFRFQAKLYLKQSDDEKSVLIDRIENSSFIIPSIKSYLSGVIGGGNIDNIVNAMVEEVIFDYVNRFQGAIAMITSSVITELLNPVLDQLDSWRYIQVLMPGSD